MAEITAVLSGKGGAGKSTFCVGVGQALERLGRKVLLIDADAGNKSLDLLLGVDEMTVFDWQDVLLNRCPPEKALLFAGENLRLLPAPANFTENAPSLEDFKRLIDLWSADFDYIFLDTPASMGETAMHCAQTADKCIIIATPDEVSARSAFNTGTALISSGISEENLRLVINRFDASAVKRGRLLNADDMIDRTYLRLLGIVPEQRELMYSSVKEYPFSQLFEVQAAFENIAGRILGKEIPLIL